MACGSLQGFNRTHTLLAKNGNFQDTCPTCSPGQTRFHHLPGEAHSCWHTSQHDQWCAVCTGSRDWKKGTHPLHFGLILNCKSAAMYKKMSIGGLHTPPIQARSIRPFILLYPTNQILKKWCNVNISMYKYSFNLAGNFGIDCRIVTINR